MTSELQLINSYVICDKFLDCSCYSSYILESYLKPKNFYKKVPNADFPGLHDYHCPNSRLFGACELAVFDVTEAKYKCDKDDSCKAFVVTTKTLWTGE